MKNPPHPHALYRRHEQRLVDTEVGKIPQRLPEGTYRVLCLATNQATGQELVVLRCCEADRYCTAGACIAATLTWFVQRMVAEEVPEPAAVAADMSSKGPEH